MELEVADTLMLGIGAFLGSTIGAAQAATTSSTNTTNSASTAASGFGTQAQCAVLTVTSVSGQTIIAKAPDGTSVTIHTTASTQYTRAGQAVTASAITVGTQIRVTGTTNSDGSITATQIAIG